LYELDHLQGANDMMRREEMEVIAQALDLGIPFFAFARVLIMFVHSSIRCPA
jgi:hypothetical protein